MNTQEALIEAMQNLDEDKVLDCVRTLTKGGHSTAGILSSLNTGITLVGNLFESGEYFVADLIVSGMIYRNAINLLMYDNPQKNRLPIGRVVIGVLAGDIHDIGKDIIVDILRANSFEVIDLGIDVKPQRFAYAVRTYKPDVLLMSGVLRIGVNSMKETIDLLEQEGLRKSVSILVGGLCSNEYVKTKVGADGWAYDTNVTVDFCKKVVEAKYAKG